jgi:hypothetical protein
MPHKVNALVLKVMCYASLMEGEPKAQELCCNGLPHSLYLPSSSAPAGSWFHELCSGG